jgi:formiminotetrahydrofolate cyclodeaminase
MVAALSTDRPRYAAHAATHARAAMTGHELADRFLDLADRDSDAYAGFSGALKLPKETDDERVVRSAAVRSAARTAAEIPLECVQACRELVAAAERLAGRSNANASSDLAVATLLGEAAARGAAANVLVNLPSVGDDAFATDMTERVDRLLAEIEAVGAATRAVVASGDARPPIAPTDA